MEYSVALSIMFEILRCKHSAKELAEEFEISTRTVYRYVENLCGAGIPIITKFGRYGGFEMSNYYRIREFFFTRNEKKFLLEMLKNEKKNDAKTLLLKINALATL